MDSLKILFATSEAFPLIKTGGLADVCFGLPKALEAAGHQIRLLLPAYSTVTDQVAARELATLDLDGKQIKLLETTLPGSKVVVWLVDYPEYFQRPGDPYHDEHGLPWSDNHLRFGLFSKVIAAICAKQCSVWQPDVLHGNDWQTGLGVALAKQQAPEVPSVFTIHNLAYMGLFSRESFEQLAVPDNLWRMESMEFHGQFSFIKGGLIYADKITTVSPTYANEICSEPAGRGLEGTLSYRWADLSGILNGIDTECWNPESDPLIKKTYASTKLADKTQNTKALLHELGLNYNPERPVIGFIGRMVEQKGLEYLIAAIETFAGEQANVVVLGSGEHQYQQHLQQLASMFPETVSVTLGYDEGLAHRIEAGSDIFLMPSIFEPCGLNQIYSMRYGTLPVVRATGGLADTVVDMDTHSDVLPNGFVFEGTAPEACLNAIRRALELFGNKRKWRKLQRNGMSQDLSWDKSAEAYIELYRNIVE